MSGLEKVLMALGLACVLGACGEADGDDSSVVQLDGGPGGDALVGPLASLASSWQFELAPPPEGAAALIAERTHCDVTIGASGFDISCRPTRQLLPTQVGEGCEQLLDDLHLSGSVFDRLEGAIDRRVEYLGAGCAALGFTTGAPYPLPVFATMLAVRLESRPLGELLLPLGGTWSWSRRTGRDELSDEGEECTVALDGAPGAGIAVRVECPSEPWRPVAPSCERADFTRVEATLTATALSGQLLATVRHRGAACGITYPAETTAVQATLSAWRTGPR